MPAPRRPYAASPSASRADTTAWSGTVLGIQPRVAMTRSFDQRSQEYGGYVLRVAGTLAHAQRTVVVAITEHAQAEHELRAGDVVAGEGEPADSRVEIANLVQVGRLTLVSRGEGRGAKPPPWLGVPSGLETYQQRGFRRLSARTFASKCSTCIWGCEMAVEMIIDHWNPHERDYRVETFCYGPTSCRRYRAGPTRVVPGRKGMSYEEQDWVDEQEIGQRDEDD